MCRISLNTKAVVRRLFGCIIFFIAAPSHSLETIPFVIEALSSGRDSVRLNIYTSAEIPNPAGCSKDSGWLQADETIENLNHLIAMAIPAYFSGKQIYVNLSESSCSANDNPLINQIYLGTTQ